MSDLDIGDSLHVRDIQLPEGVTLISDGDLSVVSLFVPAAAEEEEAVAEGEEAVGEEVAAEAGEEEAQKPPSAEEGGEA